MLTSYFQNSQLSMTKQQYFEMCEMMGSEPVDSEIPVELEDFPDDVQQAIVVYYKLKDDWDTMNGNYMGKSYHGLRDILDILEVPSENRKYILDWLQTMDVARSAIFQQKREQQKSTKTPAKP